MRKSKHSWYNARCAGSKEIRDSAWKRWRKQHIESNLEQYREAKNDYVRIRREKRFNLKKI